MKSRRLRASRLYEIDGGSVMSAAAVRLGALAAAVVLALPAAACGNASRGGEVRVRLPGAGGWPPRAGLAAGLARFLLEFSRQHLLSPGGCLRVCVEKGAARKAPPAAESLLESLHRLVHVDGQLPAVAVCPGRAAWPVGRDDDAYVLAGSDVYVEEQVTGMAPADISGLARAKLLVLLLHPRRRGRDALGSLIGLLRSRTWNRVVVGALEAGSDALSLYAARYLLNGEACGAADLAAEPLGVVDVRGSGAVIRAALPVSPYVDLLLPRDFGGCTVRANLYVGTPDDRCGGAPGMLPLETRVVRDIFLEAGRQRHFRPVLTLDHDARESESPNGTFGGSLGALERGDFEVALAPYELTPTRARFLRPTVPFLVVPARVHVRCRSRRQHEPSHFTVVVDRLWVSGIIGMVGAAAVAVVLTRVVVEGVGGGRWRPRAVAGATLLAAWALLCEVAVSPRVFRTTRSAAWATRCVFAAWLMFSLNLNVAIKGLLSAEAATKAPQPRVTSLRSLLRYKPPFAVGYPSRLYTDVLLHALRVPADRMVLCEEHDDIMRCENRFNRYDNFAVVQATTLPTGIKCLKRCNYPLDGIVMRVSYVLFTRRRHPMADALDETILRLQSAGVIEHWVQADVALRARRRAGWSSRSSGGTASTGRRKRSRAPWDAFACLGYGHVVSALVCFGEVLRAHRHRGSRAQAAAADPAESAVSSRRR
ncbi:hypothetical protein ONE63_003838 [Megalurothrips usitatus]|uniref:Uncharacterized protein n=1 Tax=Megalurothrips usitatus TaxID=439358 RepID=A0AAV7X7C0_9NEOP|nr:hypothetical protein ONE63_003838 [Megalurothrips usitatus]